MKIDKSILLSFLMLVLIASLYRILPGRPLGFAPQIAMALFGGSIIADKKYSFVLPLASMFLSDIIYEILFNMNLTTTSGFYEGQMMNYVLFAAVTVVGFFIKKQSIVHIVVGSLVGATFYFIASNFVVWIGGGLALNNLPYPKTLEGLISCFVAGIPFYQGSLMATLIFSGILFGGYSLITKFNAPKSAVAFSD